MTRVVVQRGHNNASNSSSQGRQSLSAPQSTTTSVPSSANSSTSSHPQFSSSSSVPFSEDGGAVGGVRGGGQEGPDNVVDHAEESGSGSGSAGDELNSGALGQGLAPGLDGVLFERQCLSREEESEEASQKGRAEEAWHGARETAQLGPPRTSVECAEDIAVVGRGGRGSVKGKEPAEDSRGLNFGQEDDRQGSSTSEDSGIGDIRRGADDSPSERSHADETSAAAVAAVGHGGQTRNPGTQVSPSASIPCSQHAASETVPANSCVPDQVRPNSSQSASEAVGCSYIPTVTPSSPWPSSSRRGSWLGSSGSAGPLPRGGSSRRVSRASKPSRHSPNSSRPSSPRAYGEGDGYNSGDEHNSRSSGSAVYENNEEREHQFEVDIRFAKGLEVRRMSEDGNCLFRAVAYQVYGDAEMHEETRQMCIDYMEKERDHFSQFVTESFTAYCKRKRRDKVYGNNLEIQAMAEMYNRPIHIYSYSAEPINIFHGSYETDLPPIRLSYHRGNHYNSLIDPGRPAVGAGLGFVSLRGTNVDREQVKAALKAQQDQQIDKALLAEGRFYSDIELTEQEIQRMVMEASRAEYFEEEKHRQYAPWSEETSTSAAAEPSSSATNGSPESAARTTSLAATSTTNPESAGHTANVRMLMSMGFSYLQVMEACSIFGDDVNNILCFLLETENSSFGDGESMYRKKGKAAERS